MSLTISLKTKSGKDPSRETPVCVNVGGKLRRVESALTLNTQDPGQYRNIINDCDQFATVWNDEGKIVFKGQIDENAVFGSPEGYITILKFQGKTVYKGSPRDLAIELRPKSNLNIIR